MAKYKADSPWFKTRTVNNQYLTLLSIRPIPAEADDTVYTIEEQYTHRPDLLAFDLYENKDLWWVFAQRNMDVIKDPVYDMEAGTKIFVPKGPSLRKFLGI
tara:strand:- start:256 stop:558 length:303 start_codon:yes stop_codon:yes gene_type:complete